MHYQENYKNPLVFVPQKKIERAIQKVLESLEQKGKSLSDGVSNDSSVIIEAINRYAASNIPVDYWFREMEDFEGDKTLYKLYKELTEDVNKVYDDGRKFCFAGNYGTGKTMTCACILKKAVNKGFSGLYVNLTDIVMVMSSNNVENKYQARQTLLEVDFLVIDEFDPRFMGTDNAADLYGRILEPTLRARIQNRLPLFLCTNSPNVVGSFSGALKQSISSLMNLVQIIPVLGTDFRSAKKK